MSFIKPDHLVVVSLWAEDVPTTVHFYQDVIGLSLLPHHDHRPAFEVGTGCYLVLCEGKTTVEQSPGEAPFPLVAFAVKDLDGAVDRLCAHGVELPWGVESGPSERWVKFYDPAGNLIEFAQFSRPVHR